MEDWRREALRLLPAEITDIERAETLSELWFELWYAFQDAYQQTPKDEAMIAAVYAFAFWCWHGADLGGNELEAVSTVYSQFFEHLPRHPLIRRDMARWLCTQEFDLLAAGPFTYYLNADELLHVAAEFRQQKDQHPDSEHPRCGKLTLTQVNPHHNSTTGLVDYPF